MKKKLGILMPAMRLTMHGLCASRSYSTLRIWSCPPRKGDDYIFNVHPPSMHMPDPARLQDWYRDLLGHAQRDGIVVDFEVRGLAIRVVCVCEYGVGIKMAARFLFYLSLS